MNGAAYEWIQHEPIARQNGLTTAQLYIIRDTTTPLPPSKSLIDPLQSAVLVFADLSTRAVNIPDWVMEDLKKELKIWVKKEMMCEEDVDVEEKMNDLLVEIALVTATYNMVSRFLVSVDVAGFSSEPVPWPLRRQEVRSFIPLSIEFFCSHMEIKYVFPIPKENPTHSLHTVTLESSSPSAPYVVFVNSLLTDYTMWSLVLPYFISRNYNIVLFSQRGHGQSSLPTETTTVTTTIPSLASDIYIIISSHLNIPSSNIKTIIGVSQGGATALAYAALYSNDSSPQSIIVCDTTPRTPQGNQVAWEERIQLVKGDQLRGMKCLADITIPRWFPPGSPISPSPPPNNNNNRAEWISSLIASTPVSSFETGARALGSYNTLELGILNSSIPNVLLLAGSLDGGGKVGETLEQFGHDWNEKRKSEGRRQVEFVSIEGSGHLPMVDEPEQFWKVVNRFLETV